MQTLYSFLITLRNAMKYEKSYVVVPYSVMNFKILVILKAEGFIVNFFRPPTCPETIRVLIRPSLGDFFRELKFFSKTSTLSLRSYSQLLPLLSSTRFGLISTNKGIMNLKCAYKEKVGGRILFTI